MYAAQETPVVLVTGAARGVGADVAQQLESIDAHVIAGESDPAAMLDDVDARFGRLDTLVVNASATRIDRDELRGLAQRVLGLMPAGGHIVFVTSHQAHFYPHKAVPKGYAAVAARMRANETALYAMRSEFSRAGIRFTVVSGDAVDETFASAIVTAATSPNPSGVVYVGSADYLMTA
jgi:3-oxoacyl-[acyl-carrier protein] reductase